MKRNHIHLRNYNSLLDQINVAFKDDIYPDSHDYYRAISDRDYIEVPEASNKKEWQDISKEELLKYYDFIFFLKGDKEKIYYLPTYLIHIISDIEVADSQALDCVLMELSTIDKTKFTDIQLKTIIDFLTFLFADRRNGIEHDDYLIGEAMNNFRNIKK